LIVSPGPINSIRNVDVTGTEKSIVSRRCDEFHIEFFKAFDVYNNVITLSS